VCVRRFGSWTYSGYVLDIVQESGDALELTNYLNGCPSVVQSHESRYYVMYYECCPEPYVHIMTKLKLARR